MKVGDVVKTVGGWDALIIWVCSQDLQMGFYAIHRPYAANESAPIYHWADGSAHSTLSVNEPPCFNVKHPADIIM